MNKKVNKTEKDFNVESQGLSEEWRDVKTISEFVKGEEIELIIGCFENGAMQWTCPAMLVNAQEDEYDPGLEHSMVFAMDLTQVSDYESFGKHNTITHFKVTNHEFID